MERFLVTYKNGDTEKIYVFVCWGVSSLDENISGIEMDGGRVIKVQDASGKFVTPQEIGSRQTEAW